jgi:hypothetical protein
MPASLRRSMSKSPTVLKEAEKGFSCLKTGGFMGKTT